MESGKDSKITDMKKRVKQLDNLLYKKICGDKISGDDEKMLEEAMNNLNLKEKLQISDKNMNHPLVRKYMRLKELGSKAE